MSKLIEADQVNTVVDFLDMAFESITKRLAQTVQEDDCGFDDEYATDMVSFLYRIKTLKNRMQDEVRGADITLSDDEATTLSDAVEWSFYDIIREDDNMDNVEWAYDILKIWGKLRDI